MKSYINNEPNGETCSNEACEFYKIHKVCSVIFISLVSVSGYTASSTSAVNLSNIFICIETGLIPTDILDDTAYESYFSGV